jgi:sugar lactone lactonase YvrE
MATRWTPRSTGRWVSPSAPDGAVYVADTYNDRIRRIGPDGRVTTVAGSGVPGLFDGAASSAQFDTPAGIAVAPDGALLVADTGNGVVRRISGEGDVTTLLLEPLEAGHDVSLFRPVGIAAARDGAFYVTDRRGRIVHVLPDGRARVLAGSASGFADGLGATARLHNPSGVAVDGEGALVVADALNYLVRRIAPPGLFPPDPPDRLSRRRPVCRSRDWRGRRCPGRWTTSSSGTRSPARSAKRAAAPEATGASASTRGWTSEGRRALWCVRSATARSTARSRRSASAPSTRAWRFRPSPTSTSASGAIDAGRRSTRRRSRW